MRWGPIAAGAATVLGLLAVAKRASASVVPPGFDEEDFTFVGPPAPAGAGGTNYTDGPGAGVPGAGGPTTTSASGAAELARHEGILLKLYNDSSNYCHVGVGHLLHQSPCNGSEAVAYRKGGLPASGANNRAPNDTLTLAEAMALFRTDLASREQTVVNAVTVPLTQNQFDALVSLVFNIGGGAFRDSTLLKKLNQGKYGEAAAQFAVWRRAGGQINSGLVARRAQEAALFLA